MNEKIITKNVVFEGTEYQIVKNLVEKEGYGQRGFSIALRKIIREWARMYLEGGIKPPDDPYERRVMEIMGTPAAKKAAG